MAKKEIPDWLKPSKLIDTSNPIRREILFFLVVFISIFFAIWMWAHGWESYLAGTNPNLFHESLGTILMTWFAIWAYFKLYKTSDSFVSKQAEREAAEKAAIEAKKKADQEKKDKAFTKILVAFESAKTFEEKIRNMGDLLSIGIESPSLRQRVVDGLKPINEWMVDNKLYLCTQNLISWRLKNNLFETSSRFRENSETQDASIKTISIIESIIRKHLEEFIAGHNTTTLDLSGHCLPTLNLSAKTIPAGSLNLEAGNFWQSSFSESHIHGLSFKDSDLYGSSFWRAELNDVDFQNTVVKGGKLRTNLQQVKNLSPEEFFATKEWELCFLSIAQDKAFFNDDPEAQDPHLPKWISAKIRREKLYFGIERI